MQPVQPRAKIQYKQPQRLNAVSLTLFALMGLMGLVGYGAWPALSLRSNVESELSEALPDLWRLNHHADSAIRMPLQTLRKTVTDRLRKVGVTDKGLEVIFDRNRKTVAMEARFKTTFTLPVIDKTFTVSFKPRVETDAARVEW